MLRREIMNGLGRLCRARLHCESHKRLVQSSAAVARQSTVGGASQTILLGQSKRQLSVVSLASSSASNENKTISLYSAWTVATAAILLGSATAMTTLAEPEAANHSSDANVENGATPSGQDEEEEEDPYDNLPEEDEPTECSMCNTFRQGPCRPYWRKLERCFKDHANEENGGSKCLRYLYPHQQCLMNYTNLYGLVRLTSLQEYIDESEAALPASQRAKMEFPEIDWAQWHQFQKDTGSKYSQGLESYPPKTPLWKRFPDSTEPVVLTFSMALPREDENGLLLRFAYVADQDGMVLGVESNAVYRKLKNQVEGRTQEDNETEEEEEECGPSMKFDFSVVPGVTRKIQVKAMYAKDPGTPDLPTDGSDDLLKETSFVNLPDKH